MTAKKIIVTPCVVKISLYELGPSRCSFGCESCARIRTASTPPARKNAIVVNR
jgi:hypothetical protein